MDQDGLLIPKVESGRATEARLPGVDSQRVETTEGIFEQPQERKFVVTATWRSNRKTSQRRESRRQGQEGMAIFPNTEGRPRREGSLKVRKCATAYPKTMEDSSEGPQAAPSLRASPAFGKGLSLVERCDPVARHRVWRPSVVDGRQPAAKCPSVRCGDPREWNVRPGEPPQGWFPPGGS
jgi:hypothetical protein